LCIHFLEISSCSCLLVASFCFFFFQAEDGIRDFHVTGVQTCALPILEAWVNKSPIGAEPGFQSDAIPKQAPASNSFLAGVNCIPKPIDAPGKATATVFESAMALISFSPENSK